MAVSGIKGIGEKRAEALEKMGINSLEDAVYLVPASYMDFTSAIEIRQAEHRRSSLFIARITGNSYPKKGRNGVSMLLARCADDTGSMNIIWFNQPYMFNRLKVGNEYKLYGMAQIKDSRKFLINPVFEPVNGTSMEGICPVYAIPKGAGISQSAMRTVIRAALDKSDIPDVFPASLRARYSLAQKKYALDNIHFPLNAEAFAIAKRTVAFEELIMLLLSLSIQREEKRKRSAERIVTEGVMEEYCKRLPYPLTSAQLRTIEEINNDIASGHAMNRLLQGDVGSGKTAVAFYCAYAAAVSGGQCAVMAPTEILARQHFNDFTALFSEIPCVYIYGGMKKSERTATVDAINSGAASVIIGTHAMLNESVRFDKLLFVVTDEQHRFGVAHRAMLEDKGINPHTLVLSATPIPRTLALVLYNDLDLSVLDELPPGRQKISTAIISPGREEDMFNYIAACAEKGIQSYIVCPLVEQNEDFAARSAQEIYSLMLEKTSEQNLALMHGRISAADKKAVMEDFCSGKTKILVSTTVIEVGVNVPSAVNMVIVDAERFGLSQLHQLRGRVGRGSMKSYCFLLSGQDNERLETMVKTNDGFVIAQKDLEMRGPGDYLGQRQSGMPATDFSALFADMELVSLAKEALGCIMCENEYSTLYCTLRAAAAAKNEELLKSITYN